MPINIKSSYNQLNHHHQCQHRSPRIASYKSNSRHTPRHSFLKHPTNYPSPHSSRHTTQTQSSSSSTTVTQQDQQALLQNFLSWLIANGVKGIDDSKIALFQRNGDERGIVATSPIKKGQTIAVVPLHIAITDDPDDEESNAIFSQSSSPAPWSVRLACKLLRMKYQGYDSPWYPYISVLPTVVPSPLSTFQWDGIASIGYQPMMTKIDEAMWLATTAWSTLPPTATQHNDAITTHEELRKDFEWALSVVHSRTFGTAGQRGGIGVRMLVPLIDMLNHAGDTTLDGSTCIAGDNVRWDIVPKIGGEYVMALSATRDCIAGEEILLSYGERSNDDFFLYYGFVPQRNYHDDVVLFESIEDALDWYLEKYIPVGVLSPQQLQSAIADAYNSSAVGTGDSSGSSNSGNTTTTTNTTTPTIVEGITEQELMSIQRDQAQIKLSSNFRVDGRLINAFTVLHSIARTAGSSTVSVNVQQHIREAVALRAQDVLHSMHSMAGVNIIKDLERLVEWESLLLNDNDRGVHCFDDMYKKYSSRIMSNVSLQSIAESIHSSSSSTIDDSSNGSDGSGVVDAGMSSSDSDLFAQLFNQQQQNNAVDMMTSSDDNNSTTTTINSNNNDDSNGDIPISALIYRTYKSMILWDAIIDAQQQ